MRVMPASTAACTTSIDAASVAPRDCPRRLWPPQPSPTTDVSNPVRPNLTRSMGGQGRGEGRLSSPPVGRLYLVRHADAGHRDGAIHDERRPLSHKGERQAAGLADSLGDLGITHLYAEPLPPLHADAGAPRAAPRPRRGGA